MEMNTFKCTEHGGTFQIPKKRGRPPVKCKPDNPCTQLKGNRDKQARGIAQAVARTLKGETPKESALRKRGTPQAEVPGLKGVSQKAAENMAEQMSTPEVTRDLAMSKAVQNALKAKELLEPLGWNCTAKKTSSGAVDFMGARNPELINIIFEEDGSAFQTYSIWDTVQPKKNYDPRMPARELSFNPDEVSDRELFTLLRGREVHWFNRQTGSVEIGVISTSKMQIEHLFGNEADGEPTPDDRVIKFIDHAESRFRAFRLAALIKVS